MNDEVHEGAEPEGVPPASETPRPPDAQAGQSASAPPPRAAYTPGQPPHPPPQRRRNYWIPVAIGGGCLVLLIAFFAVFALISAFAVAIGGGETSRGGNLALIRVTGTITGGRSSSGIFTGGSTGAEDLVSQLERARKDDGVKAILVRINSPGGSAAGSEEAWREIMRVRKAGKPVYASMADIAASGGYYIASACDRIYADANTVTGSIGVIFSGADMSELYGKIGFRPEIIKSGKYKDIGSPARPLTPEERALLQNMINGMYAQFVAAVAKGRNMPVTQVKKLADGRVYTGEQALKLKLIDSIGGMHEASRAAAKAGGIKGEPKVMEYQRRGFFGSLFSDEESASYVERAVTRKAIETLLREESLPGGIR